MRAHRLKATWANGRAAVRVLLAAGVLAACMVFLTGPLVTQAGASPSVGSQRFSAHARPLMSSSSMIGVSGTGSITGKVTNAAGTAAVAGVEVDAWDAKTFDWIGDAYTNASGVYKFTGLPNTKVFVSTYCEYPLNYIDEWYNNVPMPGNWSATGATALDLAAAPARASIDFRLATGRTISGKVMSSSGEPVSYAGVVACIPATGEYVSEGETDENGVYQIVGLPSWRYTVCTENYDEYVDEWYKNVVVVGNFEGKGATAVDARTADVKAIDFVLNPGFIIAGTVVSRANRQPLEMAVEIVNGKGTVFAWGVPEGPGAGFQTWALPPGTYYAKTSRFGFGSWKEQWYKGLNCSGHDLASATPIRITNADVSGIAFALDPLALYQQNYSRVKYSGTWATVSSSSASGGSYARSKAPGASATFYFNGISLDLTATQSVGSGKADIYIDGVLDGTVNLAAASTSYRKVVWTSGDLPRGAHTVRVLRSTANASDKYINVDAVSVDGGLCGPIPAVTGLSPSRGALGGGTAVTLTGTDFTGATAVKFGAASATNVKVVSPTRITCKSPAGPAGKVDVRVVGPNGVSSTSGRGNDYYYTTRVQETDSRIVYSGAWSAVSNSGASGSTYKRTSAAGASATVLFTGSRLCWIATTGVVMGDASVSVDGGTATTVHLSGTATGYQRLVFDTGGLAYGQHTVRISWKGPAGKSINIDAFDVSGTLKSIPASTKSE